MQRAVAHYPRREIAVLCLVESVLSFAVIYSVIQVDGTSLSRPVVGMVPWSGFPWGGFPWEMLSWDMLPWGAVAFAVIFTLMTGFIAQTAGLYRLDACLNRKGLLTVTSLASITALVVLLFINEQSGNGAYGGQTLFLPIMLAAWLAALALVRLMYGFVVRQMALTRRVLVLGEAEQIRAFSTRLGSSRGWIFDPVVLPGQTVSWQLLRAQRIWGVVLASRPEASAIEPLLDCKLRGVRIFSSTAFHENYLGRIDLDTLAADDLVMGQGFSSGRISGLLKRLCDILVGSCMLVLTMPLMALTALVIKIDSPGPVLYRQQRVGQFDRPFTLLKFRSMATDAEAGGNPRWAQQHDPRVTRVGRFIRATRIDELPQLVNIIRGEMSLVGPRPERPHFVEQLARAIPLYRQRGYAKPGLTGWAQVNFPYGASVQDAREKLAYDLYYVKNRSVILDMIILALTVRVVLFREGAR